MSKINIAILGNHQLMIEGILAMLSSISDFHLVSSYHKAENFVTTPTDEPIHVLIKTLYKMEESDIEDTQTILQHFPKCKILIISYGEQEEMIFQIIRAGAKGFLAHDASRQDLIEAIYSLRNGFDYFSKCITTILLNRYVKAIQKEEAPEEEKLSGREIEILTLWGDSCTNQEIAEKLFISVRTVESHKTHIMQKLNLKTAVDLMKYAIKNNIITVQ